MPHISIGALPFLAANLKAVLVIAMPEPSAIPEFVACMVGVGYLVWRRRKGKS